MVAVVGVAVGLAVPWAYNRTMATHASASRADLARRVLAVAFVVGMVLALVAAAFAPAFSGSAVVVRVGALVLGAGCAAGLVFLMRPRPSAGTPGARPICPQCGNNLTDVPAEASGRTTCPACEMSWAFGRDRSVWREEASEAQFSTVATPAGAPPALAGRIAGTRVRRRAMRRTAANWTLVLAGYVVALGVVVPLGFTLVPLIGLNALVHVSLVALAAIPLVIVAAGVRAVCRAGRMSVGQPCPGCGYDLTGLDRTKPGGAACPECGAQV